MLPGMAVIAIFMLVVGLANVFSVMRMPGLTNEARYSVLAICSMIVIGVFGFLRLKRWGWALLLGGTLFYSIWNVVRAVQAQPHQYGYLLPAAFTLVFFLYLVRDEVRSRLR